MLENTSFLVTFLEYVGECITKEQKVLEITENDEDSRTDPDICLDKCLKDSQAYACQFTTNVLPGSGSNCWLYKRDKAIGGNNEKHFQKSTCYVKVKGILSLSHVY